jgi:hypothetical protein
MSHDDTPANGAAAATAGEPGTVGVATFWIWRPSLAARSVPARHTAARRQACHHCRCVIHEPLGSAARDKYRALYALDPDAASFPTSTSKKSRRRLGVSRMVQGL